MTEHFVLRSILQRCSRYCALTPTNASPVLEPLARLMCQCVICDTNQSGEWTDVHMRCVSVYCFDASFVEPKPGMQAIRRACFHQKTSVKMSLIQGPPGTGKTSVICGIIACMLHGNTFKRGAVAERPAAAIGQGLRANSVPARRVLVCAQSNAAIDELLSRLSARGLATGTHATRAVSMLRLGSFESAHPAALQFHIDHVVDGLVPGKDATAGGSEVSRLRAQLLAVVTKISKLRQGKSSARLPPFGL